MANVINHVQLNIVDDDGNTNVILPETSAKDVLVDMSTNTEVMAGNTVIPKDVTNAQELIDTMASLEFKSKIETTDFEEGVIVDDFNDIEEGTIPSAKLVSELQDSIDAIDEMNVVRFTNLDNATPDNGVIPGSEINDNIVSTGSTWSSKKISELVEDSDSILDDTVSSYESTWSSSKITNEVASRLNQATFTWHQTLSAGSWDTASNPAIYLLNIPGFESGVDYDITLGIDDDYSNDEYSEIQDIVSNAKISRITENGSKLTFYAYGTIPTKDIRLKIDVKERFTDVAVNNTDNVELNIPEIEYREVGSRKWMYSNNKVPASFYVNATEVSRTHYIWYRENLHVFTSAKHFVCSNGHWEEIIHDELNSYLNGFANSVFCVGDGKLYGCISGYYGQSLGTTTTYQSALIVMNPDDYKFTVVKILSSALSNYRTMAIYNGYAYIVSGTTENKMDDSSTTTGGQYVVVRTALVYPYTTINLTTLNGLAELSLVTYQGHMLAMYSFGSTADSAALTDFLNLVDNNTSMADVVPYVKIGGLVHGSIIEYNNELHILSTKTDLSSHLIYSFENGLRDGSPIEYTNGAYAQAFIYENALCHLPYRYLEVNDTCYPHVIQTKLFSYRYKLPAGYSIQLAVPISYRKTPTGEKEQAVISKISGNDDLVGVTSTTSTLSTIYTYNSNEECIVEVESSYVNPSIIIYK